MLRINQLKLPVEHTWQELEKKVMKLLRVSKAPEIIIVRRSIDARKKPELYFNYILDIKTKNEKEVYKRCDKKQVVIYEEKKYCFPVSGYQGEIRPVIIGTGPAGLFCGYMLAEAGFRPILLERGRKVEERIKDVENFWNTGILDTQSNVQFGEGGAGTFSDGKLNTLVKDKYGRNREVLSIFVKEGAPKEILYDHKPHIGTDVLSGVIKNMRNHILSLGGEFRFESTVTGFEVKSGSVSEVIINHKEKISADYVVLAIGHSARDTFQVLYDKGMDMEAKPFAVGFRVEHPQEMINLSQYGQRYVEVLGSAPYKLTALSSGGRGVYSFCMCPGGYVVNASSEEGKLAINGMSYSGRDGKNANSAIIISVTPKDYGSTHPLAGIEFQRELEKRAFKAGQGTIPVERYGDFKKSVSNRNNAESEKNAEQIPADFSPCIKGKWRYAKVHDILPEELNLSFMEGMEQFGQVIKGFDHDSVFIEGIESRTSSPVRINRDDTLQSSVKGIYPCGEGAGYAGGITSAAMDGIKVAEEIARRIAYGK
ncbi:MAG: FAD-dependent oxidoreductase [Lachnospiraceae bacterium]|nr:FAD-dependent oxidoreductase [Lachnospiraceae bacterium]